MSERRESDSDDAFGERVRALLRGHRSVRKFSGAPVDDALLEACAEAGRWAATSSNVQAYSALRVRDTTEREALAELTGGQRQVAECAAFYMIAGDLRRHVQVAQAAGTERIDNLETFLVAAIDAALFAQNFVVALESEGLGTCYIGGLRNNLPAVDALLELPRGTLPLFGLCVGWPDQQPGEQPVQRPRLPLELVLADGRLPDDAQNLAGIAAYDERMTRYYAERGRPGWDWSGTVGRKFARGDRAGLSDFYRSKGASLD